MHTSFESVKEVFERTYQWVLTTKGPTYLESQETGYLAPNLEGLVQLNGFGSGVGTRPVSSVIGPQDGTPVAWVLDPSGLGLVQINDGISDAELVMLANQFYEL